MIAVFLPYFPTPKCSTSSLSATRPSKRCLTAESPILIGCSLLMSFFMLTLGLLTACGPKKPVNLAGSAETKFKRVKVVNAPAPQFPEDGLDIAKQGANNKCIVRVFIDTEGNTEHVQISECHEVFHKNTEKTVKKWTFEPYVDTSGKALRVNFKVQIAFKKID